MIITTQIAHKLVPTEILVVAITVTITCLMIATPDTTIMKIRRDKNPLATLNIRAIITRMVVQLCP